MHNMPGIPVGQFAIRPGPLLAASDGIFIDVTGKGGHAARPHECIDTVLVASSHRHGAAVDRGAQRRPIEIGRRLHLRVPVGRGAQRHPPDGAPRRAPPARWRQRCAISWSGEWSRWLRPPRGLYGATATARCGRRLSVTNNHVRQTEFAAAVAAQVAGADKVDTNTPPLMGGGGLLVHAGGATRRLYPRRQRQHRRRAPPQVRLQRRCAARLACRSGRGWRRRRCQRRAQ